MNHSLHPDRLHTRSDEVRPVLASALSEQQRIADAFLNEKLLPRRINALDVPLFKPGA